MHVSELNISALEQPRLSLRDDPRAEMATRLPAVVQPFLTWLTAKPAPGEQPRPRPPGAFVTEAILLTLGGCALTAAALAIPHLSPWLLYFFTSIGIIATTSGLGLFQVVIFHHCSHNTVFSTRERNRLVGWLVSAILLFKHFDAYQREHMLHHNANKLFTDDDEFTDFVVGICELRAATTRRSLWRRLILLIVSPVWHASFLTKRIRGAMFSADRAHNFVSIGFYVTLIGLGLITHTMGIIAVVWLLPVTMLLQIATVFRILCEHRLPPQDVIQQRGRALISQATAGVFPGRAPPAADQPLLRSLAAWVLWWADMLTVQLFVRVFVLVGDAPCHDFHHRRPGKKWTNYTHARQADLTAGCPDFPYNYVDTWGLFRAIDENFAAMERSPAYALGA